MSRRKEIIKKRLLKPDLIYSSFLVSKLINMIMKSGKKDTSRSIVYKIMLIIKRRYLINPVIFLEECIERAKLEIELKNKKVGGSTYKIPVKITRERSVYLAIKNIISFSRKRKGIPFYLSLFRELVDTYNGCSLTILRKYELMNLAELNRAFAHFAF
ncbi:small ribosomal subunit protein uS7 [Candidatus Vidania fulgoroideorum]